MCGDLADTVWLLSQLSAVQAWREVWEVWEGRRTVAGR